MSEKYSLLLLYDQNCLVSSLTAEQVGLVKIDLFVDPPKFATRVHLELPE